MLPFPILSNTSIRKEAVILDMQSTIAGTCYILGKGNILLARGYNSDYNFGVLGNKVNDYKTWVHVRSDVAKLYSGSVLSIMIGTDGKIYATGNKKGLGFTDGSFYEGFTDISTFMNERGFTVSNIKDIKIGQWSVLILKTDGTLYGIGDNGWGELGQSGAVTNFKTIASGVDMCYLSTASSYYYRSGTLYAAGRNNNGQLGRNSTASSIGSFGQCYGISTSGVVTSFNESGSGVGLVIRTSGGALNAYTTGIGFGMSSRILFAAMSVSDIAERGFFDSGCSFNMNLMRTTGKLLGTGTGVEFGLSTGTYSTWVDANFSAVDSSQIQFMVSLRSYGTYLVYNNELYAVQVSADWFGEIKVGWIKQAMPTILQ